jgi:hypothetical protein
MNIIKKLLGLCEHRYEVVAHKDNFFLENMRSNTYNSLYNISYQCGIMCIHCYRTHNAKVNYILKYPFSVQIQTNIGIQFLQKKDLQEFLIYKNKFQRELNKKYNLNLVI